MHTPPDSDLAAAISRLKNHITTIPDFPKPGIQFRDITSLLLAPEALNCVVEAFHRRFAGKCDAIAAVESRGFIFGAPLAVRAGMGLLLVRKQGTLPRKTVRCGYSLEYGSGTLEMHSEDVSQGQRVLLVDDLIATGGTLCASAQLLTELGASVAGAAAVIDLPDLGGSKRLRQMGIEVETLVEFEGA